MVMKFWRKVLEKVMKNAFQMFSVSGNMVISCHLSQDTGCFDFKVFVCLASLLHTSK